MVIGIAHSWGSRARSEVARCDLREQQGKRKKSESGGKYDHPGALMVTDDRDQAGDDGGDPTRPDTQAPDQLRPAVGVALGRFDDAEREGKHEQDDACGAQPRERDRPPADAGLRPPRHVGTTARMRGHTLSLVVAWPPTRVQSPTSERCWNDWTTRRPGRRHGRVIAAIGPAPTSPHADAAFRVSGPAGLAGAQGTTVTSRSVAAGRRTQ